MDRVIAIIPARSGSKGLFNKNIRMLGDDPLMAHSIMVAKKVKSISRIIVSTDSELYADIAKRYGAEVVMRPAEISVDNSSPYSFVKHVLDSLVNSPEYFVLLQPTTPLRDPDIIENAISAMKENRQADSLSSIDEEPSAGFRATIIKKGYLVNYKTGSCRLGSLPPSRQLNVKTYNQNGYVMIYKISSILKNKTIEGKLTLAFKTPNSIDINILEDFNYVEYIIQHRSK